MKRIVSFIAAAALVFGSAAALPEGGLSLDTVMTAVAQTYGDYEYEVLDNGGIMITKYIGSAPEVTVPSVIDNKSVVAINSGAFKEDGKWHEEGTEVTFTDVTKVTIPESVTDVSIHAFSGCTELKTVIMPDTAWTSLIGYNISNTASDPDVYTYKTQKDNTIQLTGYYGSKSSLTIPSELCGKKVTSIGASAFSGNYRIMSVSMPSSITEICDGAFFSCLNLEEVTIGSSVKTIGKEAFGECGLKSVSIPSSVTEIGDSAFINCGSLEEITIGSGVKTIGVGAFESCGLTSIIIPDSVTSIGRGAFWDCSKLESITIGSGVKTIGDYAFHIHSSSDDVLYGPYSRTITIPGNVTSIGKCAFGYYNETLTKKYYGLDGYTIYGEPDSAAETYAKENGFEFMVLSDYGYTVLYDNTIRIDYYMGSDTELVIPSAIGKRPVTQIAGCSNENITSITIPDGVTEIGDGAFGDCSSLKTVKIPDSCTSIGMSAFCGCESLSTITIPDGVTYVGYNAFGDCTNLETVYIGKNARIYENAFNGCKKLRNIIIDDENNTLTLIDGALYDVDHYDMGCDNLYLICCPEYKTSINLPKNCIGFDNFYNSAFSGDNLTTITVDPEHEIYYSKNGILYSNGSNYTPDYTYNGIPLSGDNLVVCPRGKTTAVISDETVWINDYAFTGCKRLTNITIPDGVIMIGSSAFYNCANLKSATIPKSVIAINDWNTFGCYNWTSEDNKNFTIYGYRNTAAEEYANDHGFTFIALDEGKPGDVDGDGNMSIKDVLLLRQSLAGWNVGINSSAADANGDGKVDILDVLIMRQRLAGWAV